MCKIIIIDNGILSCSLEMLIPTRVYRYRRPFVLEAVLIIGFLTVLHWIVWMFVNRSVWSGGGRTRCVRRRAMVMTIAGSGRRGARRVASF